ncbi:hypothetical protein E4P42_00385 [Mycobacterium sp. PS03-16]|nr:hypothetical protein E4P42_00385 [Mycobacterium sp. PS03-16]
MLKTFYTGPTGWHDHQLPDGTVIWTSPTGRTHTTTPAGALYFPHLAHPSNDLPPPEHPTTHTALSPERGLAMPTRRRTRAEDRAYRITWERNRNHTHHDANPPPF